MTDFALIAAAQARRLRPEPALMRAGAAPLRTRAEWRPLAALGEIDGAWQALAQRALEPNVFYAPAFAGAAAAVFGHDVGAVLAWSAEGAGERLIGLFPARLDRRRYGPLLPLLRGWTHPFAPLGLPLVDREQAPVAIDAWLDHIIAAPGLPKLLMLPLLPTEGAFAQTLRAALAARDAVALPLAAHRRALLKPAGDRAGYLATAISSKKRKELARQRRRLGNGDGTVDFTIASQPADVLAALDDFLALEAAGWKGRAGTAAMQNAALRAFMTEAAHALAGDHGIEIARLAAAGHTVAAALVLRSGDTAWFWKIAYDESAARGSPGVQVALDLTRALLADESLAAVDSCAVENHPMIDHLWRERLALADHLIALDPATRRALPIAHAIERARTASLAAARRVRRLLRRR
jgi:CelD/BcsL family acetyltransferase involved in cellulose biosynthesis